MSEAKEVEDEMIADASGIIAAARGKIKIRQAMRLVEFTDAQVKNMTLYQKVRRKAKQMMVVDTKVPNAVPKQIGDDAETVNSTLSSAEQTERTMGTGTIATTTEAEIVPTPRRLMENSPPNDSASSSGKRSADSDEQSSQKKHRRSSKEVQRAQANVVMKTKKESIAMKHATKRIAQNKALTHEDPNWKLISRIVEEVNKLCHSIINKS